jgi:hypothetical protein
VTERRTAEPSDGGEPDARDAETRTTAVHWQDQADGSVATTDPTTDPTPHVADEPAESILADRRRIRRPLPVDADEVTVERSSTATARAST